MPSQNIFSNLTRPRYPSVAVALDGGEAAVVALARSRKNFVVRRAARVALADGLLRPHFDEQNITDQAELIDTLGELAMSCGLGKEKKWSAALPEAAARTLILTLDQTARGASRQEQAEMLNWKIERGFGVPADELKTARTDISRDAEGRARVIMTGVRRAVLAEYEGVFARLGWRVGLMVPRHVAEARWLILNDAARGVDSLLISSHEEGFTALLLRARAPLIARNIQCEANDCADELYRLLLFYRDRLGGDTLSVEAGAGHTIEQVLVSGEYVKEDEVQKLVAETLGSEPRVLQAADTTLVLPEDELPFHSVAAPAGLATLAWS